MSWWGILGYVLAVVVWAWVIWQEIVIRRTRRQIAETQAEIGVLIFEVVWGSPRGREALARLEEDIQRIGDENP